MDRIHETLLRGQKEKEVKQMKKYPTQEEGTWKNTARVLQYLKDKQSMLKYADQACHLERYAVYQVHNPGLDKLTNQTHR